MSFIEKMDIDIEQYLNGESYDDKIIDRLFKLTTIKANLTALEQKKAMTSVIGGLMDKMKDMDINEFMKSNPNLGGFNKCM